MRVIYVRPIEVEERRLRVSWEVRPESKLYRRNDFTIEFPEPIDLREVPEYLLWTVVLGCLHSHWIFLRPCRVEISAGLPPEAVEFWRRLVTLQARSLAAYRADGDIDGDFELVADGAPVALPTPLADTGRCATAFSGGKDSLLQAGLLAEFTIDPVLVATTSPMPPLSEHTTPRRLEVLAEVERRLPATLVEVHSDFRSCWFNGFPTEMGFPVSINETSDTHLYAGCAMVAGYALGCTHIFLASENEVQENMELGGEVIHHPHMMYATAVQRAVEWALKPVGLRYSSLISPLHSFQVQGLLWKRYANISDLQYSCWRAVDGESMCSNCSQCLRIAMCCVALGEDPRRMGADLVKVLQFSEGWSPKWLKGLEAIGPKKKTGLELESQLIRFVQGVSLGEMAILLLGGGWRSCWRISSWRALRGYRRLRKNCAAYAVGAEPGFRPGFLSQVDELLRDKVEGAARDYFDAEPLEEHEKIVARSESCAQHIAEPIRDLFDRMRTQAKDQAISE